MTSYRSKLAVFSGDSGWVDCGITTASPTEHPTTQRSPTSDWFPSGAGSSFAPMGASIAVPARTPVITSRVMVADMVGVRVMSDALVVKDTGGMQHGTCQFERVPMGGELRVERSLTTGAAHSSGSARGGCAVGLAMSRRSPWFQLTHLHLATCGSPGPVDDQEGQFHEEAFGDNRSCATGPQGTWRQWPAYLSGGRGGSSWRDWLGKTADRRKAFQASVAMRALEFATQRFSRALKRAAIDVVIGANRDTHDADIASFFSRRLARYSLKADALLNWRLRAENTRISSCSRALSIRVATVFACASSSQK